MVGEQVLTHSGEYVPRVVDLAFPSRGVWFELARQYRSALADAVLMFGRGWSFGYAKRLVEDDEGIALVDGLGGTHLFARDVTGGLATPDGFYAVLEETVDGFVLHQQHGDQFAFAPLDAGGWLRSIDDRNGNALRVEWDLDAITVTDPFGQVFRAVLQDELIVAVEDPTGRAWRYEYDDDQRLVSVMHPPPRISRTARAPTTTTTPTTACAPSPTLTARRSCALPTTPKAASSGKTTARGRTCSNTSAPGNRSTASRSSPHA
jgi:YD repeat-containing protein